ncbi:MAG: hypothetical protein RL751_1894, partial [Bacteroidota bacterium]
MFDTQREITTHEIAVVVYVQKEWIEAIVDVVHRERPVAAASFLDLNFLTSCWVGFDFVGFAVAGG